MTVARARCDHGPRVRVSITLPAARAAGRVHPPAVQDDHGRSAYAAFTIWPSPSRITRARRRSIWRVSWVAISTVTPWWLNS